MKKIVFFLLLFLISTKIVAQHCGNQNVDSLTMSQQPFFGKNDELLNFYNYIQDSLSALNSSENNLNRINYVGGVKRGVFQIPVQAWVYSGTGTNEEGISNEVVEYYINAVNELFKNSGFNIFLYLKCSIQRQINNKYYKEINGSNYNEMFNNNYEYNAFNIHFVEDSDTHRGRFPWESSIKPYACYIKKSRNFSPYIAGVLAHEIGHAFGLSHTFNNPYSNGGNNADANWCHQEFVDRGSRMNWACFWDYDRRRCEITGDGLCDTDADPNVYAAIYFNSIFPFVYNFNNNNSDYRFDREGREWFSNGANNAFYNFMSYAAETGNWFYLRREFTPMQKGQMYEYVRRRDGGRYGANFTGFYSNESLDVYENDNYWKINDVTLTTNFNFKQLNNEIRLNSRQYHTFHWISNNTRENWGHADLNNVNEIWNGCDKDWVWFKTGSAGQYIIQTTNVNNISPDTELVLYSIDANGNITEIARNDNASATNVFSKIKMPLQANSFYAIQVLNKSPFPTLQSRGHYFLEVGCYELLRDDVNISGNSAICEPTNVSLLPPTLPDGATGVTWQVTPSNLVVVSSGTGQSANIIPVAGASGLITINFTLTTVCETFLLSSRSFWVGLPKPVTTIFDIYGVPMNDGDARLTSVYALYTFSIQGQPLTPYQWDTNLNVLNYGGTSLLVNAPDEYFTGYVKVRAINDCGDTPWITVYLNATSAPLCPTCPTFGRNANNSMSIKNMKVIAYENPFSGDKFQFKLEDIAQYNSKEKSILDFNYQVRIQDENGQVIKSFQSNKTLVDVDMTGTKTGIYYLWIQYEDIAKTIKLIKN